MLDVSMPFLSLSMFSLDSLSLSFRVMSPLSELILFRSFLSFFCEPSSLNFLIWSLSPKYSLIQFWIFFLQSFVSILVLMMLLAIRLFSYLMASACLFLQIQLLPETCCICTCYLVGSHLICDDIFHTFSSRILFYLLISALASVASNFLADDFDLYRVLAIASVCFRCSRMGCDFLFDMLSTSLTCWPYFLLISRS